MEMQTGLDAIEQLIRPQTAHGNRAHQLLKRFLAQAEKNIGKLHARSIVTAGNGYIGNRCFGCCWCCWHGRWRRSLLVRLRLPGLRATWFSILKEMRNRTRWSCAPNFARLITAPI